MRRVVLAPLFLPSAVFLASLAAALRTALRLTDGHLIYALDDAYIHMAVAKTLASHGIWGCTPFHFSSSSSSLLWTFGLGVAYRAFGVHDWTPLVTNVAFAIATLVIADVSLARFGAPAAAARLGAARHRRRVPAAGDGADGDGAHPPSPPDDRVRGARGRRWPDEPGEHRS